MEINEVQLERLVEVIIEFSTNPSDPEPTEFYFYQNFEWGDASISIHIHTSDATYVINIDVFGDLKFNCWV